MTTFQNSLLRKIPANGSTEEDWNFDYRVALCWLRILGLFFPSSGNTFHYDRSGLLSSRSELVKRFLKHLEERYPQHHNRVEVWKEKMKNFFRKYNPLSPPFSKRGRGIWKVIF